MIFYLGADSPSWLWSDRPARWPWFVSHRRLSRYKTLRPSTADWALDSGGFTELNLFGEWRTPSTEYVDAVRRYRDEVGRLRWAAPQDWMCEPSVLARTGLTVAEHQRRTVENYLTLRTLDADLPFVPVLQGWTHDDYLRHADAYDQAGIDLAAVDLVGMGTFCRRGTLAVVGDLVTELHAAGLRMHGFGLKRDGISRYGWALASADSLAWSFAGRMETKPGRPLPCGRQHRAKSCAHCRDWAEMWAERATADRGAPWQPSLRFETGDVA